MLRPTLLLLLLAATAHAAPVTFRDETFADADWTSQAFSFEVSSVTPLAGGSVTASQQPTGGNPGAFRTITHTVPAAPSPTTFGATWSVHFRLGAVWDPSTQGPLATIDFEEDARLVSGPAAGQSTGLAIRQGGQVWVAQVGTTPGAAWSHKQGRGIRASGVGPLGPGGFPATGPSPDFSASGGPIEFGFTRGNSTGAGGGSYAITAAIDNWKVRVNPPCSTPAECDDQDPCTIDACGIDGACTVEPLCGDDGDPCTVTQCAAGVCGSVPFPCDDGDPCTIDACAAGGCQATPVACDDGKECTVDGCVGGSCEYTPSLSYALAEAKARQLLAILKAKDCGDEELAKRLARKLKPKIAKLRAKVAKLDDATRAQLVNRLLGQAGTLLDVAGAVIQRAVDRSLVSAECGAALQGFLDDIRQCVGR